MDENKISQQKFEFAVGCEGAEETGKKLKQSGYLRDAMARFGKNKGSVVAAVIVLLLVLFAAFGPLFMHSGYVRAYGNDKDVGYYQYLPPRLEFFGGGKFWGGLLEKEDVNSATYHRYAAMRQERGHNAVIEGHLSDGRYALRLDAYRSIDCFTKTYTLAEYSAVMQWQDESGIQVILPFTDSSLAPISNSNVWYVCDIKGNPVLASDGSYQPAYYTYASAEGRRDDYTSRMRLIDDPYINGDPSNGWCYAWRSGTAAGGYNYTVRVDPYNYFIYKYGFEPSFAFGTDANGYDIFTRLAGGARFSMLFALAVSAVNLVIGAVYGAIEGYYGGTADLIMERFSDILSGLPTMVVTVLFNLHLTPVTGVVPALLYALVLTGWIGIASRTRMQFYRFKSREYVLAARTLGASDRRLIWRHIFPNALGTLITSSVLIIPGVIFSETSLTYLGIINLDSPSRSSVGAMLSSGQAMMTIYPHVVLFPAIFIGLLMISFNLFGNGLRDAFNPSLRGAEE